MNENKKRWILRIYFNKKRMYYLTIRQSAPKLKSL